MNHCAYVYGWWAAAAGTPELWNPFPIGSLVAVSWRAGHRDSAALERPVQPRHEPEVKAAMAGERGVEA